MSKRTFAVILTLLCSFCIGQALAGGIVLQRTRVIYDASRKEAALPVANKGAETPYLLQSWVDNIDGKSRAPFIITPPLFRLEAGDDSSLRIIKTADNLPENKESLFYINVRAIPAKKKSDDVNANELTLVFKTRIKMFYRPAYLKGRVNDAWKSLEFKRSDHSLNIYNPTEYYVVFAGLAVDKTDLTSKIEYIAPGEHKQLPLPASGGKNVKWAAINDYGGSSDRNSSTAIKNIKTQVIRECHNDTTRDINAHRNSWRSSSNVVCRWCSLAAACFALPLTPKSIISTPLCWKPQKVVCKQPICRVFQKICTTTRNLSG